MKGFSGCGVSLANRRPPAAEAPLDLEKLRGFDRLEFPGSLLGRLELTTALSGEKPAFLAFSRLLDAPLTRQAADFEGALLDDFLEQFYKRSMLARSFGCATAGADFDLERAAVDRNYHARLGRLLRILYAPHHDGAMTLTMPLRIPHTGADNFDYASAVRALRDWQLPHLAVTLELHIHEIRLDDTLKAIFDNLKYNTAMIRVIYEPELGNALGVAALLKLAELFAPCGERLTAPPELMLSPVYSQSDTLPRELELYHDMFESLKIQL
ncbi:MAG: hypothetical protein PHI85_04795 [Victivallaceae bacterium]|nr:hypothetical protein [Victivallaceae bacterium]